MNNSKNISLRIQEERKKNGFSQSTLAEKIGKSVDMVKKYECQNAIPPHEVMIKMSDIFKCDIRYLYGEQDVENLSFEKIAEIIGLSVESIKVLNIMKEAASWNDNSEMNKLDLELLDQIISSGYNAAMESQYSSDIKLILPIIEAIRKYIHPNATICKEKYVSIDDHYHLFVEDSNVLYALYIKNELDEKLNNFRDELNKKERR